MAVLLKAPERVQAVCVDIAQHYQEHVVRNGFGAQVVTSDRESCLLYKKALDQHLPPETSDIVMSINSGEEEYAQYRRDWDAEEKLLDRFRDPNDPLKIIIVTSKLLTGFDAPILQTMYLDRPLRDHTLLQTICRTNRPFGQQKTHGLIVDCLGIFDDVAQAIQFDEEGITKVVSNISELKAKLPVAIQKCLEYFPGVDLQTLAMGNRSVTMPGVGKFLRILFVFFERWANNTGTARVRSMDGFAVVAERCLCPALRVSRNLSSFCPSIAIGMEGYSKDSESSASLKEECRSPAF